MKTINITLKIEDSELIRFDNWLREQLEVISLKVLPDTNELYEEDDTFKKLVKGVKTAQRIRDKYIYEHNK